MSSKPKPIEEMETWEILRDAIPRGESDNVAQILRRRGVKCTGQQVRGWRNDPDVDDNGVADPHGRRNPLDEVIDFMNAVGARDPKGSAMIRKRVDLEDEKIQADHGRAELLKDREAIRQARKLAQEFLATTEHIGDG